MYMYIFKVCDRVIESFVCTYMVFARAVRSQRTLSLPCLRVHITGVKWTYPAVENICRMGIQIQSHISFVIFVQKC